MSGTVVVRQASLADHPALVALESRSQLRPWSPEQLLEELQHPAATVLVADDGESLAAMVAVRLIVDELWVLQVGTAPSARRKGLARNLLRAALSSSTAAAAKEAWLEVRASNASAIALYRSFGFQEQGRRRGYYPPLSVVAASGKEKGPREDAVLFSLDLSAS